METKILKISEIKLNPNNPRLIKGDKFEKLVNSIKEFPEMLKIRPIVVNKDMIILGGNMRFKACKEAGLKEIPVIIANELTSDQEREFLIKDNVSGGEWDWSLLNDWDKDELDTWDLDIPNFKEYEEIIPSGYEENQKWFLNIEFENENECQKKYEELIQQGLICKIVQ
jgi:ParB-like chromosome segregation protein Spo0J